MTTQVLSDMRALLAEDRFPTLVTWRTVWRAHIEFGLLLRFDDVKRYRCPQDLDQCHLLSTLVIRFFFRLTMESISFEENATGRFIRVKLEGGKTVMTQPRDKNDRVITPTGAESCLFLLTER